MILQTKASTLVGLLKADSRQDPTLKIIPNILDFDRFIETDPQRVSNDRTTLSIHKNSEKNS